VFEGVGVGVDGRGRGRVQTGACETAVVLQGCVSRTADARQSQSAGPTDTSHPACRGVCESGHGHGHGKQQCV
jgi:hypothetical protein